MSTENDAGDAKKSQPGELAKGLAPLREQAGLPPGEGAELNARVLNVGLPRFPRPPQRVALEVTEMLQREHLLFRMGKELGEIDPATGDWQAMDAHNFVTWIKNTANIMPWTGECAKQGGHKVEAGLGIELARVILKSNDMRVKMPVIERINHVKMPVMREEKDARGLRKIEILRPGYDSTSKTFTTLGGPDFDEKMDLDTAVNGVLWERHKYLAWRDPLRDWPIHLAAMLTMFCRGLAMGRAPMFVYNANISNSGKTICAWLTTWITHGSMDSRPLLEDSDERLIDTLDTLVKARSPYLFFDNVDWKGHEIRNALLDEFLTKKDHVFRVKGGSDQLRTPVECVTVMTGNGVKLSIDLQNRSLICDFWNSLPAEERPPLPPDAVIFDDEYFENELARSDYLAALYALVRDWDESGRPVMPGRMMSKYATWSRVIPSIIWHAGKKAANCEWNCLRPNGNLMTGDQATREYRELARYAIEEFGLAKEGGFRDEFEVSVAQLAGIARRYQIATEKLWPEKTAEDVRATENDKGGWRFKEVAKDFQLTEEDQGVALDAEKNRQASEWLSAKSRSSFGIVLTNKLHDLSFKGPDGFLYLFRHVPNSAPTVYRVKREPTGEGR